jgi:Na+-transporting methylmalonyl-CoA/oxaloacetate decarboxylase gamma subunit
MNIDTDVLLDSAVLVLMGMAVVFTGLFTLMVAAMVLVRFSPRSNTGAGRQTMAEVVRAIEPGGTDGATIAAMAVALALSMRKDGIAPLAGAAGGFSPSVGPAGTWAAAGREQQMRSRGKVGHKWGRRSE